MEASASDGHGSTPHGPMPQIAGFMREDHQTSQAVMIPKVQKFILRISVKGLRKKALRGCHLWSVSPLLQSQIFLYGYMLMCVCVLPYLFHVSSMPHGRSWKTVCPWNAFNEWILSNSPTSVGNRNCYCWLQLWIWKSSSQMKDVPASHVWYIQIPSFSQ